MNAKPNAPKKNQLRPATEPSRRASIALVLSVLLHALISSVVVFGPKLFPSSATRPRKTEVVLLTLEQMRQLAPPVKDLDGQIVEQDKNAINDEKPKDSKLLSRHNQTVVQETQASAHGKFKNTDNSSGERTVERQTGKTPDKTGLAADKDQLKAQKQTEPAAKEILTADDGVDAKKKPNLKDLIPSFKPAPPPVDSPSVAQGGGDGPSATDDRIKNVKTGMQTLLSTREFVYYSYYNRIKDKLRQYWEPKIKEKMERIVRQGRTIASSSDRITRIVIVLDRGGTLMRVQIIGPSGVNDLDEAAVEAFRAAAPFPNPPKGIVDPDGTIKIRWDFILEANAAGLLDAIRMAQQD